SISMVKTETGGAEAPAALWVNMHPRASRLGPRLFEAAYSISSFCFIRVLTPFEPDRLFLFDSVRPRRPGRERRCPGPTLRDKNDGHSSVLLPSLGVVAAVGHRIRFDRPCFAHGLQPEPLCKRHLVADHPLFDRQGTRRR